MKPFHFALKLTSPFKIYTYVCTVQCACMVSAYYHICFRFSLYIHQASSMHCALTKIKQILRLRGCRCVVVPIFQIIEFYWKMFPNMRKYTGCNFKRLCLHTSSTQLWEKIMRCYLSFLCLWGEMWVKVKPFVSAWKWNWTEHTQLPAYELPECVAEIRHKCNKVRVCRRKIWSKWCCIFSVYLLCMRNFKDRS